MVGCQPVVSIFKKLESEGWRKMYIGLNANMIMMKWTYAMQPADASFGDGAGGNRGDKEEYRG